MRCPKCGYNSFDHLDSCKKCGRDLVEFKQRFGIKSMLFLGGEQSGDLGADVQEETVETPAVATPAPAATSAAPEPEFSGVQPATGEADDFGFDFMGDSSEDDDLSFDELFEEAAAEEDVEETLEAPDSKTESENEFDLSHVDDDLEDDFGFDVEDNGSDGSEGRKDPFDLPESSPIAGTPEFVDNAEAGYVVAEFSDEEGEQGEYEPLGDTIDRNLETPVLSPLEVASFSEDSLPTVNDSRQDVALSQIKAENTVSLSSELEAKPDKDEPCEPLIATAPVAEVASFERDDSDEHDSFDLVELQSSEVASLGSRILAFVYDLSLLLLISVGFIAAAEVATASGALRLFPTFETFLALSIPYFLMIFVLVFAYFTLFHFLTGQTPGKMLTALRVESIEREPLTIGQAFLRSVGGLIQLVPVGLGFISVLLYPQRRGLSDRLAGTLVVRLKATSSHE
jgi:uncharacterized RDD family membrane protein YckC